MSAKSLAVIVKQENAMPKLYNQNGKLVQFGLELALIQKANKLNWKLVEPGSTHGKAILAKRG